MSSKPSENGELLWFMRRRLSLLWLLPSLLHAPECPSALGVPCNVQCQQFARGAEAARCPQQGGGQANCSKGGVGGKGERGEETEAGVRCLALADRS